MKGFGRILVGIFVLAAVALIIYPYLHTLTPTPQVQPSPEASVESPVPSNSPSPSPSPSDHYPLPSESELPESAGLKKPIPPLDESDPTIQEALGQLFGKEKLDALFNLKDIVRRFVSSVESLGKHDQPTQEISPIKPLETKFLAAGKGEERTIDPRNFKRYHTLVDLVRSVDMHKLVTIYIHFYPLFQAAYQDLGTPGYFNDHVVKSLDLVLATPDIDGPIQVHKKSEREMYKYSDEKLESLPVVQKMLIRAGAENVAVIKLKARELRALLVQFKK